MHDQHDRFHWLSDDCSTMVHTRYSVPRGTIACRAIMAIIANCRSLTDDILFLLSSCVVDFPTRPRFNKVCLTLLRLNIPAMGFPYQQDFCSQTSVSHLQATTPCRELSATPVARAGNTRTSCVLNSGSNLESSAKAWHEMVSDGMFTNNS